jgi:hypothetical protein
MTPFDIFTLSLNVFLASLNFVTGYNDKVLYILCAVAIVLSLIKKHHKRKETMRTRKEAKRVRRLLATAHGDRLAFLGAWYLVWDPSLDDKSDANLTAVMQKVNQEGKGNGVV